MSTLALATNQTGSDRQFPERRFPVLTPVMPRRLAASPVPSAEQLIAMEIDAWARRAMNSNGFGAPEAFWYDRG